MSTTKVASEATVASSPPTETATEPPAPAVTVKVVSTTPKPAVALPEVEPASSMQTASAGMHDGSPTIVQLSKRQSSPASASSATALSAATI